MEEKKEWKIGHPNKSYSYILPMLGYKKSEFKGLYLPESCFRNCFIGDDTTESKSCKNIYLLYKFSFEKIYSDFIKKLEKHPEFVKWYKADKFHDMFLFSVPNRWRVDYVYFKQGQYSEFQEEYKQHILKFFSEEPKNCAILKGVLYKEESGYKLIEDRLNKDIPDHLIHKIGIKIPRDMEVSSKPNFDDYEKDKTKLVEVYQECFKHKEIIKENKEFYDENI